MYFWKVQAVPAASTLGVHAVPWGVKASCAASCQRHSGRAAQRRLQSTQPLSGSNTITLAKRGRRKSKQNDPGVAAIDFSLFVFEDGSRAAHQYQKFFRSFVRISYFTLLFVMASFGFM
jgi:hypothetical protein